MKSNVMGFNQSLHYQNIVSVFLRLNIKELDHYIDEAIEKVLQSDYTLANNFFYCINSSFKQPEDMIIQLFIPVNEEYHGNLPEGYSYHSYFQIVGMVGYRTPGNDIELLENTFIKLIQTFVDADIQPLSPVFFIPSLIQGEVYFDLLVKAK